MQPRSFDIRRGTSGVSRTAAGWLSILMMAASAIPSLGQFTAISSIGNGAASSVLTNGPGSYTFIAGGNDTWDDQDNQGFLWTEVTGDFDVKVRVESLTASAAWTKAGLELRESLAPRSRMAFERVTPPLSQTNACDNTVMTGNANDVHFAYRTWNTNGPGISGGQHEDGGGIPAYPNAWVRLQRVGPVINGYYGTDGISWTLSGTQDTTTWGTFPGWPASPLPAKVFLGLAASRHSGTCPTAIAEFRDFSMTAGAFGGPFIVNSADSRGNPLGIRVQFTRPVKASTAVNPLNYTITDPGLSPLVSGVAVGPAPDTVYLTLNPAGDKLGEGHTVTVSVTGLQDANGNPLTPDPSTASFIHGLGYEANQILIEKFRLGGEGGAGGTVPDAVTGGLFSQPAYQWDTPDHRFRSATWEDSLTVDSGDPQNEQFVTRIIGVLNISADGMYRFAVASDDNSTLFLSTDATAANKVNIAHEEQWNGHRAYASNRRRSLRPDGIQKNQSEPIHLAPGTYYMEQVHSEGGGGNNVSAAWDAGTGAPFVDGGDANGPIPNSVFIPSRYYKGNLCNTLGNVSITKDPQPLTVNDGLPGAFSVQQDGTPAYTYQWLKNGAAIAGANSQTYTFTAQTANDGANYSVIVCNEFSCATSHTARLTVPSSPVLVSCSSSGNCHAVYLTYSRPMQLDGVYTIVCSNNLLVPPVSPVTVTAVAAGPAPNVVKLSVSPDLLPDTNTYYITVTNAHSADGFVTSPNPSSCAFVHGAEFSLFHFLNYKWDEGLCCDLAGLVHRDITGMPPNHVYTDFTPLSVFGPTARPFTAFESPWLDFADNYSDRALGYWLVPATGSYDFWSASDDGSVVYMATDADPSHKFQICYEPNWAGDRVWADNSSQGGGRGFPPSNGSIANGFPLGIPLTAGQVVYLEIDHTEGTGGDQWGVTYVFPASGIPPTSGTPSALKINQFEQKRVYPADGTVFTALCDVFCNSGPSDQSVFVGQSAKFAVIPDGTPPYTFQWCKQPAGGMTCALIPSATSAVYTTPPQTESNDGDVYCVTIANAFSTNRCCTSVHVLHNPIALSASTRNDRNHIYVTYNKPVAVDPAGGEYTLDGGHTTLGAAINPANASEVIVATDDLGFGPHVLTIGAHKGVVDIEMPPNPMVPAQTNFTLIQGAGRFCADFNDNTVPVGTIVNGTYPPTVPDGTMHLTEQVNSQGNHWIIPIPGGQQTFMGFSARWQTLFAGTIGGAGSGFSFNVGVNPTVFRDGEAEGASTGLSVDVDTYNNGANGFNNNQGGETGIEIKWNGTRLNFQEIEGAEIGPALLENNTWVNDFVTVTPSGFVTFTHNLWTVTAQIPSFTGILANEYVFAAETYGANELCAIDNVCINDFLLSSSTDVTPLAVTVSPGAITTNECSPVTFSGTVAGSGPYTYQWYRNNVLIPGANDPNYAATAAGTFKLVVSNLFASGSGSATMTVSPAPPHVVAAKLDAINLNSVRVAFASTLASAGSPSQYSISGGVTVVAATLLSDGYTVVLNTSPMSETTCYTLTVTDCAGRADTPIAILGPALAIVSAGQSIVAMEAEDYDSQTGTNGINWTLQKVYPPGWSGRGYMNATPYTGINVGNGPTFSPYVHMDYRILFPTAGTYYFFLRGASGDDNGGGNSVHIGLDGSTPNPTDPQNRIDNSINDWGQGCGPVLGWGWVHNSAGSGTASFINVPTPGLHTFSIIMREDGVKLDQFILTTDPAFTKSPCDPAVTSTTVGSIPWLQIAPPDNTGKVNITWLPPFRLQSSGTLGNPTAWADVVGASPYQFTSPATNRFYRLVYP